MTESPEGGNCSEGELKFDVNNMTVCLDPFLMCDGHPQLSDGSDEADCEDRYRERDYIKPSATFPCESPHHNQDTVTSPVTWWATRCDGHTECHRGVDELGCDTAFTIYICLGRHCTYRESG